MGRARRWVCMALVAVCALAADARADKKKNPGLFDFGSPWKLPSSQEREEVQRLRPRGLDRGPAVARGDVRTIRLRIYADKDYRGLVLHWQAKTRVQIQRINAVIESVFNARFEIESLRDWNSSHVGRPLGPEMIDEMAALGDDKEVDLVVGLVTPLKGVATSIHSIGRAEYLSRRFIVRGMDDEQEFRAFERDFKLVSPEERQQLYAERKTHKEIVIFLHEWGHTLGLLHHEDRRAIMNPAYDPEQAEFTDYQQQMVMLVLERRLAARQVPFPEAADLLPLVEAMPSTEGTDAERARLLEVVRAGARYGAAKREPKEAVDLTQQDVDAFNRAVSSYNGGHPEEAWKLLAPVVQSARTRKVGGATWARIAELAAGIGALTGADDAASRAGANPAAQKLSGEIESTRHKIALPLDAAKFGVPPEREPAYVAGFWATTRLVDGTDAAAARARLGELAAAFPDAPGVDVLTCDLELRAKHAALASKHCEAALAKFKGATRAHYLLALIAIRARRDTVAEKHFRQAVLLDPVDPANWRALAQFYRATGASKRLADLEKEHQALLSSPLPE
jgi:hypothetical protein